jgi:hypothetical protein
MNWSALRQRASSCSGGTAFAEFTHRLPAHLAQIIAWGGGGSLVLETFPVERIGGVHEEATPGPKRLAFIFRSKLLAPLSRPRVTKIPLPGVMRQSSPARRPNCATRPLRNSLAAPRPAPRIKRGDAWKGSATPTALGVRGFLLASRQPAARPSASGQ